MSIGIGFFIPIADIRAVFRLENHYAWFSQIALLGMLINSQAVTVGATVCFAVAPTLYYPPNREYCFHFVCLSVCPSETLWAEFCAANSA